MTDSSYVVGVFQGLETGLNARELAGSANFDILLLLREAWFLGVNVCKVKSHVPDDAASSMADTALWHVLGNRRADIACKAARALDMSVLEEMTNSVAEQNATQLK